MPRFPNHRGEFTEIENQVWADMINSIPSLRDDEIKAKALGIVRQLDFASSSAPASNAPTPTNLADGSDHHARAPNLQASASPSDNVRSRHQVDHSVDNLYRKSLNRGNGQVEVSSKNKTIHNSFGSFIPASPINQSVNLPSAPGSAGAASLMPFGDPSLLSFDQFATKWDCIKARRGMRLRNEAAVQVRDPKQIRDPQSSRTGRNNSGHQKGGASCVRKTYKVKSAYRHAPLSWGAMSLIQQSEVAGKKIYRSPYNPPPVSDRIYGYSAVPGFDHGVVGAIMKNQTPDVQRISVARPRASHKVLQQQCGLGKMD
ncbi:hypothetical protein DL95DRAFT_458270 [Leptodontidium sp. 2 PMI_412]|nr:hypothetical protein DL95DRAFT_458270 [Leptodontidium sp. 2 PMI_412]